MFADTSGWASLVDRGQSFHALTSTLVQQACDKGATLITTNYVLAELTALLTSPLRMPKQEQIQYLADIRAASWVEIVLIDSGLDAAAWLRSQGVAGARSMSGGIDRWAVEIDPRVPRY